MDFFLSLYILYLSKELFSHDKNREFLEISIVFLYLRSLDYISHKTYKLRILSVVGEFIFMT